MDGINTTVDTTEEVGQFKGIAIEIIQNKTHRKKNNEKKWTEYWVVNNYLETNSLVMGIPKEVGTERW